MYNQIPVIHRNRMKINGNVHVKETNISFLVNAIIRSRQPIKIYMNLIDKDI